MKKETEPLIFIVGVGRSGTTLLQSMLNAHGEIGFPGETHFVRNYLGHAGMAVAVRLGFRKKIMYRICHDRYLRDCGVDARQICAENSRRFRLHDVYQRLLQTAVRNKGKTIAGDKDPKNIEYLPLLIRCFPNARIIHLVRDPRDVVLSRMKAEWSCRRPWITHLLAYRLQLEMGWRFKKKWGENKILEVHYENLIREPENQLKRVCGYIGTAYHRSMLDYPESAGEIVRDDEMSWKKNCFKPVMQNNYNKWSRELSAEEVYLIEKLCAPAFDKYGYVVSKKKSFSGISVKLSAIFWEMVFRAAGLFYRVFFQIKWMLLRV